jgi:hypothetical protein
MAAMAIVLILIRDTFGGPLRMVFNNFGMSYLWFVPDMAMVGMILITLYAGVRSHLPIRKNLTYFSLALMALPVIVGFASGNNLVSVLSGVKIMAPFILCLNTPMIIEELSDRYFFLWIFLLVATVACLCYNQFFHYPWEGVSFSQFGATKDVSRLWWAKDGADKVIQRYAGASVASVSAAALVVVFYALLKPRLSDWRWEVVVVALACYAIYVTNSRTTYFCLLLAVIASNYTLIRDRFPRLFRGNILGVYQQVFSYLFLAAGMIPLLVALMTQTNIYTRANSMGARLEFTWPGSFERIGELGGNWAYLYGTGFGSFGSPSYYSHKYVFVTSDCDNFMLYQFAILGVAAAILYYMCSRIVLKSQSIGLCMFASFTASAFSTNCEMPENLIFLGCAISAVLFSNATVQYSPVKLHYKLLY